MLLGVQVGLQPLVWVTSRTVAELVERLPTRAEAAEPVVLWGSVELAARATASAVEVEVETAAELMVEMAVEPPVELAGTMLVVLVAELERLQVYKPSPVQTEAEVALAVLTMEQPMELTVEMEPSSTLPMALAAAAVGLVE